MPLDWPKCVAHALLTAEVRHAVSAKSTAVSCWLWSSTPPPLSARAWEAAPSTKPRTTAPCPLLAPSTYVVAFILQPHQPGCTNL